jgi:hypothetical protein
MWSQGQCSELIMQILASANCHFIFHVWRLFSPIRKYFNYFEIYTTKVSHNQNNWQQKKIAKQSSPRNLPQKQVQRHPTHNNVPQSSLVSAVVIRKKIK